MIFDLDECQNKLGYKFKDVMSLRQCFTHASYANEHKGVMDNERLEFLGDSVLGLIIAEYLYITMGESEGNMTFDKQKIVSTKPLSAATRRLGVEKYLLVGGDDGRTVSDRVCENLFESIIGGIYLDGGYENAKRFVLKNLIPTFMQNEKSQSVDYKSALNEYAQKHKLGEIKYRVVAKDGQEHNPSFKVVVSVGGNDLASGIAGSKKYAQQNSAKEALEILNKRKKKQC